MAILESVNSSQLDVWKMANEPIQERMSVHLLASYLVTSSMLHRLRSLGGLMRWRIRRSEEKLVVRYMRLHGITSRCRDAACNGKSGMWSPIASVALQVYSTSDHRNCCGASLRYQHVTLADVGGEEMWDVGSAIIELELELWR